MKILALGLGLLLSLSAQAKECIDWQRVLGQEAARRLGPAETLIQVAPFKNDTELKSDDWVSDGIAHLLVRYLSSQTTIAALASSAVGYLPSGQKPNDSIAGMFQHQGAWLRIFVQLKNEPGKLILQLPVETPFPLHKQFFTGLRKAAEDIFKKLGREKINIDLLKRIENETANVHAFENYMKGKQAFETYDRNKMEVALIWFQEARREDPSYSQAYQGLAEVYGFLLLYHKQKGETFAPYLEALQNTLKEMALRTRQKIAVAQYPILKAHVHYVSGKRALDQNNAAQAVSELKQAFDLVPYDPTVSYALAQSYAKLGDIAQSEKYRAITLEMNACLK